MIFASTLIMTMVVVLIVICPQVSLLSLHERSRSFVNSLLLQRKKIVSTFIYSAKPGKILPLEMFDKCSCREKLKRKNYHSFDKCDTAYVAYARESLFHNVYKTKKKYDSQEQKLFLLPCFLTKIVSCVIELLR